MADWTERPPQYLGRATLTLDEIERLEKADTTGVRGQYWLYNGEDVYHGPIQELRAAPPDTFNRARVEHWHDGFDGPGFNFVLDRNGIEVKASGIAAEGIEARLTSMVRARQWNPLMRPPPERALIIWLSLVATVSLAVGFALSALIIPCGSFP